MKLFIATIATVLVLAIFGTVIVKSITLKQNCTGYLKRAADANTVEMAKDQLGKSISYLESNGITKGYTSVLWQTPNEDIEFWYNNLKTSYSELSNVKETTSSLERTNLLMKLRETLMDSGKNGDSITVPNGLSRYPNNGMYGIMRILATIIGLGLIVWGLLELDEK
jgi:hypothetical protein